MQAMGAVGGMAGSIMSGIGAMKSAKAASTAAKAQKKALENQQRILSGQEGLLGPLQQQQVRGTQGLLGPAFQAASGGFNTDLTAQERQAIEGQYAQARQGVMQQSGARGGLMQKMLGNLDMARADTVANAINNAKQTGINRALTYLQGQNPLAIGSLLTGGANQLSGSTGDYSRFQAGQAGQAAKGFGSMLGQFTGPGGGMESLQSSMLGWLKPQASNSTNPFAEFERTNYGERN